MKRKYVNRVLGMMMIGSLMIGGSIAHAEEPVEITFSYWGTGVEKEVVEAALKSFEENNPGIKVNPMHIPSDYDTKIATMLAGGNMPDIGYMNAGLAFEWAEGGYLVDVWEKMDTDEALSKEDYLGDIWYTYADGTKSFGLPCGNEPFLLFYNEDILKAAGVEAVPSTAAEAWDWDKFVEICKVLTVDVNGNDANSPDFDPENIQQYAVSFDSADAAMWLPLIDSNGGAYYDEESNYVLNSPETAEALQKLADLIYVHHVAPTPMVSKSLPSAAVALQTGKVAMTMAGQWIIPDLDAVEGLNFNIGVYPKIGENIRNMYYGGPACIFATTEHPEEAWMLWKWLTNPEAVLELNSCGLWTPTRKAYYEDEELLKKWTDNEAHPSGFMGAVVEQSLNNSFRSPTLYVQNFNEVAAIVGPGLDPLWLGTCTAQEALDAMDADVQAVLAK